MSENQVREALDEALVHLRAINVVLSRLSGTKHAPIRCSLQCVAIAPCPPGKCAVATLASGGIAASEGQNGENDSAA